MSVFSNWLQSAIAGRGWQAADLARALDVNPSLVSKWLSDEAKPSRRMTAKLCIVFRVPADYLLPLIDYTDAIDQMAPPDRDAYRAELLTRLPMIMRLFDCLLALPVEKQVYYVELMLNLLQAQGRRE